MGLRPVGSDRFNGDFRRPAGRKVKFPGGDAAERDAFDGMLPGKIQAGTIGGGELLLLFLGQLSMDNGPHCVEDIAAGKVEGRRNLRLAGFFLVSLLFHQRGAGQPQLDPRVGVDGVVDAAVAGIKTPQQPAVGRIDDGVTPQGGDVPPPQVDALLHRAEGVQIGHPLPGDLLPQVGVLDLEKRLRRRLGRPEVKEGAEEPLLSGVVRGNGDVSVFGPLQQHGPDEKFPPFPLGHWFPLLSTAPTGHCS